MDNVLPAALLTELRELREPGCTDSDIIEFIEERNLDKAQQAAVWLQIAIWNAPECCKPCKYVQSRGFYPCSGCSRPKKDMFVPRE